MKKQFIFAITAALAALASSAHGADVDLAAPLTSVAAGDLSQTSYLRDAVSDRRSYRAWQISLAPVIASEALDAYSSRGLHELNPLLASSNGSFGGRATILKLGITGTLLGVEYLVMRKHPGAAKIFWKLNLASAAVTGATAVHNYSLH